MKHIFLAAAAMLLPTTLFAADLPSRSAPPVFVAPLPLAFDWTGFYVGVNAGFAFKGFHDYSVGTFDPTLAPLVGTVRPSFTQSQTNGFTGGGQIGYNYEFKNFTLGGKGGVVVGLEADVAYTDQNNTTNFTGATGALSSFYGRTDYVGTARGRIGYALDNIFFYGTGGFAYGGVRDNLSFFSPAGALLYSGSRDSLKTGYAYGGGIEAALPTTSFLNVFKSSAVTVKGEFIHYDLGSSTIAVPNLAGADLGYVARIHTYGELLRVGLNYKFDSSVAPAPIVAKY